MKIKNKTRLTESLGKIRTMIKTYVWTDTWFRIKKSIELIFEVKGCSQFLLFEKLLLKFS